MARREIRGSDGAITGSGMATAGLALGYVQMVLVISLICLIILGMNLLGSSIGDGYSDIIKNI